MCYAGTYIYACNYYVGCHAEKDIIYGISWPSITAATVTTVFAPCSRGTGMYFVGIYILSYILQSCIYNMHALTIVIILL